jgi:hypothetical protein
VLTEEDVAPAVVSDDSSVDQLEKDVEDTQILDEDFSDL